MNWPTLLDKHAGAVGALLGVVLVGLGALIMQALRWRRETKWRFVADRRDSYLRLLDLAHELERLFIRWVAVAGMLTIDRPTAKREPLEKEYKKTMDAIGVALQQLWNARSHTHFYTPSAKVAQRTNDLCKTCSDCANCLQPLNVAFPNHEDGEQFRRIMSILAPRQDLLSTMIVRFRDVARVDVGFRPHPGYPPEDPPEDRPYPPTAE